MSSFSEQLLAFQMQANQIEDLRLRSEVWIYCNLTGQPPSKRDFTQSQTRAQSAFSTWAFSNLKKWDAQTNTPFRPLNNETLGHYYYRLLHFPIVSLTRYQQRCLRSCTNFIKKQLLEGILLSPKDKKVFFDAHYLGKWGEMKPKNIDASRHPINHHLCRQILDACATSYLENERYTWAASLLVLFLALTSTLHRYRRIGIKDIINLKSPDLSGTVVKIKGIQMPVSKTLAQMLDVIQQYGKRLFMLDRSTMENHLESVTRNLPCNRPITPETFLEEPHFVDP